MTRTEFNDALSEAYQLGVHHERLSKTERHFLFEPRNPPWLSAEMTRVRQGLALLLERHLATIPDDAFTAGEAPVLADGPQIEAIQRRDDECAADVLAFATIHADPDKAQSFIEYRLCAALVDAHADIQSTRAKRCETCHWWERLDEDISQGECPRLGCQTDASWSCADHTPK